MAISNAAASLVLLGSDSVSTTSPPIQKRVEAAEYRAVDNGPTSATQVAEEERTPGPTKPKRRYKRYYKRGIAIEAGRSRIKREES